MSHGRTKSCLGLTEIEDNCLLKAEIAIENTKSMQLFDLNNFQG